MGFFEEGASNDSGIGLTGFAWKGYLGYTGYTAPRMLFSDPETHYL